MGHWGVKSYENDDANDALDAGFEQVHGDVYEELMDDRNPLCSTRSRTPGRGEDAGGGGRGPRGDGGDEAHSARGTWDEAARLGFAGVVVRHAELGVADPRDRADTGHRLARARGDRVGRGDQAASAPREGDRTVAASE